MFLPLFLGDVVRICLWLASLEVRRIVFVAFGVGESLNFKGLVQLNRFKLRISAFAVELDFLDVRDRVVQLAGEIGSPCTIAVIGEVRRSHFDSFSSRRLDRVDGFSVGFGGKRE